jgi:hypothetical protein
LFGTTPPEGFHPLLVPANIAQGLKNDGWSSNERDLLLSNSEVVDALLRLIQGRPDLSEIDRSHSVPA